MAAVKTLSRTIVDALGVPLPGKVAVLKNNATGTTITSGATDANGVYSFPNLDETTRYRVEVSPGGASTQVYRASPADAEFGHLYAMDSLRTAAGAVVAFGGAVSMGGLTVAGIVSSGNISVTNASAIMGLGSTAASNTPGIDFHSSGNVNDYDVRLIASGGAAGVGQGALGIAAATITLSGHVVANPGATAIASLRAVAYTGAATTVAFATFELSSGQTAWGVRGDGIVCDVAATSISIGPSPTRMLRVWNGAGVLLGYIPIHPGA